MGTVRTANRGRTEELFAGHGELGPQAPCGKGRVPGAAADPQHSLGWALLPVHPALMELRFARASATATFVCFPLCHLTCSR